MSKIWENGAVLGVRLSDFTAGTFLFTVAIAILTLSILLIPALQLRLIAANNLDLYPEVVRIVLERDKLDHDKKLLMAQYERAFQDRTEARKELREILQRIDSIPEAGRYTATNSGTNSDLTEGELDATLTLIKDNLIAQHNRLNSDAGEIRFFLNAIKEQDRTITDINAQIDRFKDEHQESRAVFSKIQTISPSFTYQITRAAFVLPYELVVLKLVVLMGALGGVISVAKAYVTANHPNPQRVDYFIRPIFGMVIAFVVFLLFKAGQLVLATQAADDPLNPFPIALLGVVSGLMAKEAIARIEEWGIRIFGGAASDKAPDAITEAVNSAVTVVQTAKGSETAINRISEAESRLREFKSKSDATPTERAALAARLQEVAQASDEARTQASTIASQTEVALSGVKVAANAESGADQKAALDQVQRAHVAASAALTRLQTLADDVARITKEIVG